MASQFKKAEEYVNMQTLDVGEYGEVMSSGTYKGMVVTKMFTGQFVAVHVPEQHPKKAFEVMWGGRENINGMKVRKLKKGEQVILSND